MGADMHADGAAVARDEETEQVPVAPGVSAVRTPDGHWTFSDDPNTGVPDAPVIGSADVRLNADVKPGIASAAR